MRVLFVSAPAIGHAFPMVPLAWAFRAAGHDVVFLTAGDGLAVANAGLTALDALPGQTTSDMHQRFVRDLPELFAPVDGPPLDAMNQRKPIVVSAWDPFVDPHVALAEQVHPDLVVYDPIFGVGALVGALLKVPAVAHAVSITRYPPELLRGVPAFRRHGIDVPEGIETIDIAPPSLGEGPPSRLPMRYVPYNGAGVLPGWLLTRPRRPRIAVTFGTLDRTRQFGYAERILTAATTVDAEFVLALGDAHVDLPDELPSNVRIAGWIPMNALLPTCAAAIHHGGGTSLTCCALGVVQMVLPEGAPETMAEAELLRARGAAHVRPARDVDGAAIRELIEDDALRRVAADLRAEIAALPSPSELVPRLTALA